MKKLLALRAYAAFRFTMKRLKRDNLGEYAGYSALFVMLSFVPFIMIMLNILKSLPFFYQPADPDIELAPGGTAGFFRQIFAEASAKANGAVLSVTTVAALWSASRGLIGIINGLNRIHRVRETRGFLRLRISAVLYMLLFIAAMLTVLLLLVFGRAIITRVIQAFPELENLGGLMFSLRWAIGFCLLILLFLFIYTALPIHKGKPFTKLPGAVFGAAGWLIFSGLYSVYVNDFANYSYVYGSLATIALLILWLYVCMYILFLGEELNVMLSSGYFRKLKKWLLRAPSGGVSDTKPPEGPESRKNREGQKNTAHGKGGGQ